MDGVDGVIQGERVSAVLLLLVHNNNCYYLSRTDYTVI